MPSIFSRIVAGEIPCHRVYEDQGHLAFLDINPVQPGHVLVVPKREVDYLFDLSSAEQAALWAAVGRVEAALRRATGCRRVVVVVVGYEVPHAHVHLIPTNAELDFPIPPRRPLDAKGAPALAASIQAALTT
jgi:histidine triad (HIT) family protein